MYILISFLAVLWGSFQTSQSYAASLGFSVQAGNSANAKVNVFDGVSGFALTGATVTITSRAPSASGVPSGTLNVLIQQPGYETVGLVGVNPGEVTVYLKPLPTPDNTTLASGKILSWPSPLNIPPITPLGGSTLSGGFILKSLNLSDVLHLSQSSLVSPLTDKVQLLGQRDLPSNLVFPKQSFLLGSVHLDKQTYRLPIETGRTYRLAGIQGEIHVSDLPGPGSHVTVDITNKVQFQKLGLNASFIAGPGGGSVVQDIAVNIPLIQQHTVNLMAAPFDADLIATAITDIDGDWNTLFPTDFKGRAAVKAGSSPSPLKLVGPDSIAGSPTFARRLLCLASTEHFQRVSGIVTAVAGATVSPGAFLDSEMPQTLTGLPKTIDLGNLTTNQIGSVSIETGKDWTERYTLATYYVLPGAGSSAVDIEALAATQVLTPTRVIKSTFEFSSTVDASLLDGQTVIQNLTRFAHSASVIQ